MNIAIGADHAGLDLKNELVRLVASLGHQPIDVGAHGYDANDDYPDFALAVAQAVQRQQADRGILCCGSGVGASVAANKVDGIRAAICHDTYSAHQGVEHDDMNVLCMGGRIVGSAVATELVKAFLSAKYSGEARHDRRLQKVLAIEKNR